MTPYDVIFTPGADADFNSILHFIAADNPVAALSFVDRLQRRAIDFLSTTPNAGTRLDELRYTVFSGYVVVYSVDELLKIVRVVLVTEGHRNWRSLLESRN